MLLTPITGTFGAELSGERVADGPARSGPGPGSAYSVLGLRRRGGSSSASTALG